MFRSTNGGQSWTGGSQVDPRIDVLAVDPRHPSVLYAGTGAGVFKSVDAGRNWTWSGLGQTPRKPGGKRGEGNVFSIVVDPNDSRVIYAVAGVVGSHVSKSTDAGKTWHTLPSSPAVDALAIDPANPEFLFAAVEGPWTQPNGPGQSTITMSRDGGATWHTVLSHDGYVWAITAVPTNPTTVYAAGSAGVLVSADAGQTWSPVRAPANNLLGLAVDGHDPSTIYVSSWKNGVFRSSDGGQSWSALDAKLTGPVAIDPQAPATLYLAGTDVIVKTVDGGKSWRRADAGIVASSVISTAIDPHDDRIVYAGTYGGLYRSGDRGRTWQALRLGADVQAIAVDPTNPAHLLASGSRGIVASTNRGRTWSRTAGSTTGRIKVASKTGIGKVSAIVFDPHHPRTVFAAEWGAGVIKSTDGGHTWRQQAHRPAWISTISVDPLRPETLYTNFEGGLLSSTDGGSSWKWHFFPIGALMAVLAIDPSDPQTLYASIGDASSRLRPSHLARSTDGGKHWRFLKAGTQYISATALAIQPRDPTTIYAATQFQGVLRTTDGGATWKPFNTGLQACAINTLALGPTGNTLYAGTDGAGMVRVRLR